MPRMSSARLERWIARKFRLRHVQLIAEAYDCRSILKAAQRLHLSQPTVTKALKDVETTLGLPLFERTNRGLKPTAYGEIFARHAKIVLAQLRHAAEELEGLRAGYSGKVTVGTLLACFYPLKDGTDGPPFPVSQAGIEAVFSPHFDILEAGPPAASPERRRGLEWLVTARRRSS
jgi:molybdenum-dependent DNA-binding transcriptional regulator ModE